MYQKLPYYMAYPIQTEYDERAERTDLEYMKSLYPDLPKRILPYVEEECDRMEYTGSVIFDVYPDKLQLDVYKRQLCMSADGTLFIAGKAGISGACLPCES